MCFKLNTLILDPWTRKLIWFGPVMNLEFDVRVFQQGKKNHNSLVKYLTNIFKLRIKYETYMI